MSEGGAAAASRGPDGGLSGSAEDAGDGVAGDGGGEGLSSGMIKNDPGAGSWTRRPVTTATPRLKDRKSENRKFPFYALFVVIEFENDSHPVEVRLCQAGSRRFGEKTHNNSANPLPLEVNRKQNRRFRIYSGNALGPEKTTDDGKINEDGECASSLQQITSCNVGQLGRKIYIMINTPYVWKTSYKVQGEFGLI